MMIPQFKLERYFAKYEFSTKHLLCCSDCESLSVGDLLSCETDAIKKLERVWLGYTESLGLPILREKISDLYENIGVNDVLVHAGAEEAIFNFMNVILEKGDHIIVHTPCYQSLFEVAQSIGCEITKWEAQERNDWQLDLDFLESAIRKNTKVVIINCPHNPTGYLIKQSEFDHLVKLSQKHGFIIFSDEVYRTLEYNEADRLTALCDLDDRGVSLGVMSKSFGLAGLRIGWIATRNKSIYQSLAAFKDYTTICNSATSEYLATLALRHGKAIVDRNMQIIKQNLNILDEFFQRHSSSFLWRRPKAGPIAFPKYLGADGIEKFCHKLVSEAGVLLLPSTLYDYGNQNFRIGFGRKNLPECVQQLDEFLQKRQ
jgi:aspartate/methionine/tyrosine aminotransferase